MISPEIMRFLQVRIYLHQFKNLKNVSIDKDDYERQQFVLALNRAADMNYTMICFKDLVFGVNHSLQLLAAGDYAKLTPLFHINELSK